MKKTLLAAALLAGFAGAASAQSSVTLYGIIDGGIRYQQVSLANQSGVNNFGADYGKQNGNRWGLKGVEDIGGGNRVTFMLENGFELGNGTGQQGGRMFGRQSWFGVESNTWGYVRLGRQLNFATEYLVNAADPFGAGFGQLNMGAAFGAGNTYRLSNAIKYQTPNMSGFQAGIGYSFANGATGVYADTTPDTTAGTGYNFASANNQRQLTLGARYANGPVYVAASYDQVYGASLSGTGNEAIKSWNLAGSYDFKVVKLMAGYGQTRDGVILGQGNGASGAGTFSLSNNSIAANGENVYASGVGTNSYIVGATVPVNPVSRVLVSWTMLTPNTNMKDAYNAQNQTAYNLAYTYDFTKRTNLYTYVSTMRNVATVDTAKSTQVGVGMRHQF